MSEPKITEIPLASLAPDKRNANRGTDRGRQALRHSLETYGAGRSILLAADGTVLAGNKTWEQAAALGHEQVLVVETDGSRLVAVKRTDLESDSDEARSLALADNRVGQLDLDFDPAAIDAALADGLDLSALWTGDELEELLRGLQEPGGLAEGADADAIPEDVETRCQPGELWSCGRQRLWVGDCTDAAGVARLLDGKTAGLCFTDPPYNIDYGNIKHPKFKVRPIANDAMDPGDWREFCEAIVATIQATTEGCVYVCHAPGPDGRVLATALDRQLHASTTIIWKKDQFTLGRGKYQQQYEPIWFGWTTDGTAFTDDRTLTNVWDIPRPKASEEHPTMKPVALVEMAISHASRAGDLVYDPFLGSGTTLIACEATGRTCFGCEIDAQYASVVLARWEAVTGQTAQRLS